MHMCSAIKGIYGRQVGGRSVLGRRVELDMAHIFGTVVDTGW